MVFRVNPITLRCFDFLHRVDSFVHVMNQDYARFVCHVFADSLVLCFCYPELRARKHLTRLCVNLHDLQGRAQAVVKLHFDTLVGFQVYVLALRCNQVALRRGNLRNGIPAGVKPFQLNLPSLVRHALIDDGAAFFGNGKLRLFQRQAGIFIVFFNQKPRLCAVWNGYSGLFPRLQLDAVRGLVQDIAIRRGDFRHRIRAAFQPCKHRLA